MGVVDEASRSPLRTRDAARTRGLLLEAGRRRFAGDGYAATTVRDIADDAGVNVALIKRYFGSKRGLFEACLDAAISDLGSPARRTDLATLAATIAGHAAGVPAQPHGDALLMLLRSSGDADIDTMRRQVMLRFSERIADVLTAAGHHERGGADRPALLLEAEIVLATALGIAILRASPGLDPLRAATEAELATVVHQILDALVSHDPDA